MGTEAFNQAFYQRLGGKKHIHKGAGGAPVAITEFMNKSRVRKAPSRFADETIAGSRDRGGKRQRET